MRKLGFDADYDSNGNIFGAESIIDLIENITLV